jgi:hypothetical protein
MAYIKDGVVCFDDVFNVTVQTDAEKAQRLAEVAEAEAREEARLTARQAVLDRLGITSDEAALILS